MSKFYTQYDRPPRNPSPHGGVSMTDISAMKDTDINSILRRHNIGDNSAIKSMGVFGDVTGMQDFAENVEFIRKAKQDFMGLPSSIRDRFGNDPVALVNFLQDSANDREAVRLGLKVVKEKPKSFADEVAEAMVRQSEKTASAAVEAPEQ